MAAVGATAGECAVAWLGMRREVEIFIKPNPTPDPEQGMRSATFAQWMDAVARDIYAHARSCSGMSSRMASFLSATATKSNIGYSWW